MLTGSSSIRIGGLASGMDTESIVKQLMKTERAKMERFTQRKTYRTWQQEAYQEMNRSIATYITEARKKVGLEVDYFGNTRPDSKDKMNWLKTATSSNEKAFTVQAASSAMTGNYNIEVTQLASSASISSSTGTGWSAETKLSETMSIADTDTIQISVNGKNIDLSGSDTLRSVAKKIQSETGVSANFDTGSGRLFLSTKKTGSDAKIEFGNDVQTADFMTAMGLQISGGGLSVSGQNAKIKVNGGSEIEYQSNNIHLNGLDITLKNTTAGAEHINVSLDVDGAYKKVKEFVDEYNKMIDTMNKKISEEKYRDYAPLTSEQREALKENDIKLWEEKAKSGLLKDDEIIRRTMQRMRGGMYEKVADGGAIYNMGITTGNYKDGGKLQIDENKFKKALQEDPDKVMQTLFGASSLSKETILAGDSEAERARKIQHNNKRNTENGVFVRAFENLTEGIEDILTKSGPGNDSAILRGVNQHILNRYKTVLGSRNEIELDIRRISKRMDDENRKLTSIENRYWRQFSEMEKAMQKMQSQSGWLAQQFAAK